MVCLRVSMAVKRHHDHNNSHKGKCLIGPGLQFQRFRPLLSWQEAWQHAGQHGAGQRAEVLHFNPQTIGSELSHTLVIA